MKKYKMFNKGAPEKEKLDFAEYPHGKWIDGGHGSECSPSESHPDPRASTNKTGDNSSSSSTPNQNTAAQSYPNTASNGQHYDRYHIAQGELSDKVGKTDPSSDLSWHPTQDRNKKSAASSQLPNKLHDRLKQRVNSGSTEGDSNEVSPVMKVALGEIGSISKYVSQGPANISDVSDVVTPPPGESSYVSPPPAAEGEDESNVEMLPELTITNAFSLSAEMWDTGQDQKADDEPVELESKNPMQGTREEFSNNEQNSELKSQAPDSETFDLSKVKKEIEDGPFSCSQCGMVTPDSASLQEHMTTHKVKKTKVYLHQCSVPGCDFSTNVIREFISHYSVNHDGLPSYVCRWCKGVMNSLSVFVDHVRENFVVPWVKCPHCHLKKKNKSEVVEHISTEHPGESQRVIAGSMFLCRSSSHSREKDSKIFSESHKTLVSLLNNQKYILNNSNCNGNDNILGILDPSQSGQGYQCTECSFNTANAQVFLAHIKVCESMKGATKQRNVNFECKECSFATSSREVFLNHSHVKASLMNGMKRAPYKKRPIEVRNELIRKKILSIKRQTLALKMKKDKEAMELEASQSGENEAGGHFKFSCPYCSEKFHKLNRMKFHIFLSHRDSYSQTFPLHQCLSCHMKSSSEEIVRQHIERTHFGRKSGILLINEPSEIIPRKYKTPDTNKKLVQSIAPIIKVDPGDSPKKPIERCSSWGRNQGNEDPTPTMTPEVNSPETTPKITSVNKLPEPVVDKETPQLSPKPKAQPLEQTLKPEPEANLKKKEEPDCPHAPPPKNLAMEIIKFTAGDHFTEYIQCPRCSYQSRSVMGFYGHIKRHLDLVVHINTRRKYEFHKPKSMRAGGKTEGEEDAVEGAAESEAPSTTKKTDEDASKENPEEPDVRDPLSPMSPPDPEIKSAEAPLSSPPKLESIIINKKSENLIDKDEYSKLGGPILNAKLSSLYTSNGQVKVCNICDYMADFPCFIHRHLLSAHLNIHFWECGYCFYRHLQRHKVIRHCTRNHTNREPYAKWLGIPDWEKKLAVCLKKTKSDEDVNVPSSTKATTAATESPVSSDKSPPNSTTPTAAEVPKVEKSEPTETVAIEKLPGNLFKCGNCTMCSIHVAQVLRHIRYQHNAEGRLPSNELESGTSGSASAAAIPQKPLTPSQPHQMPARPPVSAPSTVATVSSPAVKKSPTDQADKSGVAKTKSKKKITPITVPKTPYRCVFCNYINMSATEVKKHMWREHSDELNNVGILLKSKEENEKASHAKSKSEGSNAQEGSSIKRKLKRTYRPHRRKKAKAYSECVKEPGKKKSLAKASDSGLADTPPKWAKKKPLKTGKRQYVKKESAKKESAKKESAKKDSMKKESVDDLTRKRLAIDINNESPVIPKKKRQIQSTQHSDYEWESPSLAEPPNSRSERIYKSFERTEEVSSRMSSTFERFSQEKEDLPFPQGNYPASHTDDFGFMDSLAMPVFRKAEMDIYKRFIFKTYDGTFLCNYCLISMNDEIEARQHILEVHPKKPTNPLEQPCKTFQLFRKKTRRPEIIVPHAAQPRVAPQNKGVQKKGTMKKKGKSMANFEVSVAGMKKESRESLFDLFETIGNNNQDAGVQQSASGGFDEKDERALLKAEGDIDCVFTWKWIDPNDKDKTTFHQYSDAHQISVLKLITYRQGRSVTGHFKCPFCQMISTSHVRVSDHIRVDHMELERFKCRECFFKSWFSSLLENHKKLQHVVSPPAANDSPPSPKDDAPGVKAETGTEPVVQAPLAVAAQEPCIDVDGKKARVFTDINVVTDYRTLYLRTYCQKSQAVMYMCTICLQVMSNQKLFFDHVMSHYGDVYQCTACSFKTYPREVMEEHIHIHHQSTKPNLIVLSHEPILNVEDNPQSESVPKLVINSPLIRTPSPDEKPLAPLPGPKSKHSPSSSLKLTKQLTFCCLQCPVKSKGLKAFQNHLDHHYKQANKANSVINDPLMLSPYSAAADPHNPYIHSNPQKPINFAVRVNLTDMFSFYSDNVFSFYS